MLPFAIGYLHLKSLLTWCIYIHMLSHSMEKLCALQSIQAHFLQLGTKNLQQKFKCTTTCLLLKFHPTRKIIFK